MAAEADMTIVIKARDATQAVLSKIGGGLKSFLLSPLTVTGKVLDSIYKRFFSLKALLVGGGILAFMNRALQQGNTNDFSLVPKYTAEEQQRVDRAARAWERIGASLSHLFGITGGEFAEPFEAIGDFLRDHKDDVQSVAKWLKEAASSVAEIARLMANGQLSIGGLLGFKGTNAFGIPQFSSDLAQKNLDSARAADLSTRLSRVEARIGVRGPGSGAADLSEETIQKKMAEIIERLSQVLGSGGESFGGTGGVRARIDEKQLRQMAILLALMEEKFKNPGAITKSIDAMAEAMASSFGEEGAGQKGLKALVGEAEDLANAFGDVGKKAEIVGRPIQRLTEDLGELNSQIQLHYLVTLEEVNDTISGQLADTLVDFQELLHHTGRAFTSMVSSILKDLGRLLLYRGLFNLIGSALGAPTGPPLLGLVGNNPVPIQRRAGGGPVGAGQTVLVGENGPEILQMGGGGGGFVHPNGGGVSVHNHFHGPADPREVERATERALAKLLQTRSGTRARVRTA